MSRSVHRTGSGHVPGSVLIAVASWLLALTGGGALFASFSAQYYGKRSRASRVAAELAPQAGLQAGTARSYLYAELDGKP